MGNAAFEQVWQKIAGMQGEVFQTSKGIPFRYRFHKTYVVVSSGSQSVPRTYFEKIFRRIQEGTVEKAPVLQGQTFILGILTDQRLQGP